MPLLRRRGVALLLLAALAVAASAAADVDDGPEAQAAVGAPAAAPAPSASVPASTDAARAARDAVVNVEAVRSVSLDGDPRGSLDTNGFVVATTPGGKGIVATDHFGSAARASPALYTLRFADGGSVPAKLLYYDPADDFAFLEFDLADRGDGASPTKPLRLGTVANLTAGSPLTLIAEQGDVTTRRDGFLVEPRSSTNQEPREGGNNHAARRLLTTFERAAGLAGSPVLAGDGSVVALHSGMEGAYSQAVPIDKIKAALDALLAGRTPPRGDLGAALRLLPAGVARRSYRLPPDAVPKPTDGGTPQVISVASLLPGVDAAGGLQPGDIIVEVDGATVGDDVMAVDRAAGARAGATVPVVVYRNGSRVDLGKVPVRNLESLKVKKFALFGGGTFQDLSDEARFSLPSAGTSAGVLMTEAEPGTPLARLTAVRPAASSRAAQASDSYAAGDGRVLITQINGQKVANLDDFIKAVNKVAPGSSGYAVARDLASASSAPSGRVVEINFNMGRYPLQVFTWDGAKLEWVDETGSGVGSDAAAPASAAPASAPASAATAKAKPAKAGRALLQAAASTAAKPGASTDGTSDGVAASDTLPKPTTTSTKPAPELAASKPAAASSGVWSSADKARFRKGVVAVRRVTDVPLDDAARGDASHSGVVVNVTDDRVVIATASLTTNSPTTFEVTFYDGTTAKARFLYSDYVLFLGVDRKDAPDGIVALPLASGTTVSPGDKLLMLAAADDATFAAREGTALVRTSNLQTNIPIARNSRFAPVFDVEGRVVAVHDSNSAEGTLSFERLADYVAQGLGDVVAGKTPPSHLLGITTKQIATGLAARHYALPASAVAEVGPSDKGGVPQVTVITAVAPWSPSFNTLLPGDILYRFNGTLLRDDYTVFALASDAYVNKTMPVQVYRNGTLTDVDVGVLDANRERVRRYAKFAGGVFHDLVGAWRFKYGASDAGPGVLMSFAAPGSTFATLVSQTSATSTAADAAKRVLLSLNGVDMTSLDALIATARNVTNGETGWAVARSPASVDRAKAVKLTFNTRIAPLQVFVWDDGVKDWVKE